MPDMQEEFIGRARFESFERDKEALLEYHARLVPEDLDGLTPEQRRTLYRMMRLTVLATPNSELIAEWCCNDATTPQCGLPDTMNPPIAPFKFRALLAEEDTELELAQIKTTVKPSTYKTC
jgi:hypothetical protein